jgi:hypothetical protein
VVGANSLQSQLASVLSSSARPAAAAPPRPANTGPASTLGFGTGRLESPFQSKVRRWGC